MTFSSLVFLCIFLPIVFCLHTLIPSIRVKNGLLIVASLIFYAFGEPIYVFLMFFSAFFNYCCARLIGNSESKASNSGRAFLLAIAVVVNIGLLCIFKYTGLFVATINDLLHLSIPVPAIALPIGISFFTFQALSYVIDVYRNQVEVQRSFPKVLLYISFFPQLIAGPIVKYKDIAAEIEERQITVEEIAPGLRRFILGLGKKVLIANAMAVVADNVFSLELDDMNIVIAWIGAVAYVMQIYFDFSGYSDMAIGLGKMFGFHFKENFNYPYISLNIKEFWRRWHISLSSWFKDYVYIPLGGNRKGSFRTGLNKLIVFFLTGLWHGANWTFVAWGLFHGFFSFLEEFFPRLRRLPKIIGHIYLMLVVIVGFVIFRADSISQAIGIIRKMFTGFTFTEYNTSFAMQQLTPFFIVMLIVAVLASGYIQKITAMFRTKMFGEKVNMVDGAVDYVGDEETGLGRGNKNTKEATFLEVASYVISLLILIWCLLRLSGGSYNPFIYFRF